MARAEYSLCELPLSTQKSKIKNMYIFATITFSYNLNKRLTTENSTSSTFTFLYLRIIVKSSMCKLHSRFFSCDKNC